MQPDYVRKVLRVLSNTFCRICCFVDVHVKSELARQLAVLFRVELK